MIPVTLWFKWPSGAELAVKGFLNAIPRVGDEVTEDSASLYNWTVTNTNHHLIPANREVWIDLELTQDQEWSKQDRVAMRKQLEKAGWDVISEVDS
jgi:hypothetical protein